jgi:HEAT repeat protein
MNSMKKCTVTIIMNILLIGHGQTASTATVEELIKTLHSHDQQKQLAAVESLDSMRTSETVDGLLSFIYETMQDWQVKIRAIRLLGQIDDPGVSDKLVTIFNDPFLNQECPAIKVTTALALGKPLNRDSRAVGSLIDALTYDNLLVQEAVIESLGMIGNPEAVPFLMPFLHHKSFAIKMSTIKALEQIGHPEALSVLRATADREKDPFLREATLSAIKHLSLIENVSEL